MSRRWFARRRRVPVLLQAEMLECAHACLAMVLAHHGAAWSLERLRERFVPASRGTSVSKLVQMAQTLGLETRIYRAEPGHLGGLALPCVLHWDVVHFVVLEAVRGDRFVVVDPAIGRVEVGAHEFDRRFTGIAIELQPGGGFGRAAPPRPPSALGLLAEGLRSHVGVLAGVALLALLLEGLGLLAPLFVQAATDRVLPNGDGALLALLAAAFAASALLQSGVALARSALLIRLGEALTVAWNSAVCQRLLRLPYEFFVRRSIGDIHSRFGSIDEIQRTITHRFVEGLLDGVTALLALLVIAAYSATLAMLTLGFTAAYALFRLATLRGVIAATERSIRRQAAQQGLLLEILHGMHSIKANGHEANQLARYGRRTRDAARATARLHWRSTAVDELGQAILRLHWIAAVAAGSVLALRGQISAGMLVAYATYAYQFSLRSARVLDLVAEWRTLLLHSLRLADIVDGPAEHAGGDTPLARDRHDLQVRGLHFRYDADGPWILRGLDLTVGDGECVAITGPSGIGKSTLGKLLIGLLHPEQGEISVAGTPLVALRRDELRDSIGCVLQDDQLFNGTIAENIAFFDPGFCRERVIQAAQLAQIHDEIMAMPLRYDARVIDLGASLSGGQRQRLILARALYRQPRILVLDEASSHLDLANERRVNAAISALRITRIIIAHRPQTLAIADRVLRLEGGMLHPEGPRATASRAVCLPT